ncbi:AraC family transcriptional regulator [Paenibacillus sp. H1-7]|uniref:helix-turn-helix domain-containing protein n=1 Tax=Paenibacillus sp. H1-7 TaxID=2282849 RepID=UPI001EF98292|nr:AraC family transcriptional regulator [Paenibacillus sp. H1-7]ULL13492.1 AraC family transcriptional regulator [Paenibacillus sp. H1-7]
MKIPIYRFRVDYLTQYSDINPLLLFAQKYVFGSGEQCPLRICYANALVLVESGSGTLLLKDQEYSLRPGSMVYIQAGAVHRWRSDEQDPMVHRCAYFDWKYVDRPDFKYQRDYFHGADSCRKELLAPPPDLALQEVTKINNIPLWVSYYNSLTPPPEVLGNRNPWDSLKYNGAFQTFLHHFLTFAMKREVLYDPRIKKLLERIEASPLELSERMLYEWAKELGLGKSRFHDLFKTDTGYTPNDYLKRLTFHHIAEDLCFSNASITEIAEKYGFSSIHYFSKAFRNMTGLSPTEYKEKYRSPL